MVLRTLARPSSSCTLRMSSAEGLVLGAGGDVALSGEVGEEGGDFCRAEIAGVAEALGGLAEADVAFDPAQIVPLGAQSVAEEAEFFAAVSGFINAAAARRGLAATAEAA